MAASERDLAGVIWDIESGEQVLLDQGDLNCFLASPSWSPEGDRFVTGCVRREIKDTPARVWDAETGEELGRVESEDGNIYVMAHDLLRRVNATESGRSSIRAGDLKLANTI